jgi:type IV secretion system protein TrbL
VNKVNIDGNILSNILAEAKNILGASVSNIFPYAKGLLYSLCVIDLILAAMMHIGSPDAIKNLIAKILKYGFFVYLVDNWGKLLDCLIQGFRLFGVKAAGTGMAESLFTNPSAIASKGIDIAFKTVLQPVSLLFDAMTFNPIIFCKMFIAFWIIACFFIIALQLFLTYIQFYLMGTLTLVFIPFGANRYTAWVAQKSSSTLIAVGTKVMVAVFIAGLCQIIVTKWSLPLVTIADPLTSLKVLLYMALGSTAMTVCAWQIPKMAADLFSGAAPWSVGGMVGSTAGMAQTVALARMSGGGGLGAQTVAGGSSAVVNATKVTSIRG